MKLNQLIKPTEAVFHSLQAEDAAKYESLFGDTEPLILDLDFFSLYGERTVAPLIKNLLVNGVLIAEAMTNLAKILYVKHYDAWKRIHDTVTAEYEPLRPYDIVDTIDETHGLESENASETKTNYDTYGFNSDTPVDDKDSTVTDSGTSKSAQTVKRKYERHGNIGNTSFSELIQKELEARQFRFLQAVYKDIADAMTLQIYE